MVRSPVCMAIAACAATLVSCGGADETNSRRSGSPGVDSTTLYNSVAVAFMEKYQSAAGYRIRLSNSRGTHCGEEDGGVFDCELEAKLGLGAKELWGYQVTLNRSTGCWQARTYQQHGAYQSDIEAYQNDEFLAPSKKEVASLARRARRLRTLSGCAKAPAAAPEDESGATFIETMAAQAVRREFPGKQAETSCKALGKDEIDFAPDSWEFECVTELANGRKYVDKIACFDPPPYEDFDSCSEHDGYPRKPPRPVP